MSDQDMEDLSKWRWCRPCDVKWWGDAACWVCGVEAEPQYPSIITGGAMRRYPEDPQV